MARGRQRSTSNVSGTNGHQPLRPPTASPQLKRQYAVASDSIYQNNLNVLRRRDPTIVTIVDQFNHVCLYHYIGEKWLKQGFEGGMFLVEHQDAPKYGMFILNKMGTGDFSQRIYPEDEPNIHGEFLMYRYFPKYTEKRLSMNLPYPLPAEYRALFDEEFAKDDPGPSPTDPGGTDVKDAKGTPTIWGLWMFQTDAREPMKNVVLRLHSYVKQGLPYPDEYRYVPGRNPPGGHSRKTSQASSAAAGDEDDHTPRVSSELNPTTKHHHTTSEVDKLFARIQPQPTQIVSSQSAQVATSSNTLLDALSGKLQLQPSVSAPSTAPSEAPRGLALLDSIFASVASAPPTPSHPLPSQPEDIQIVSPKPTSSALPQILNQDVIYSLLGLGSDANSRASSVAPSTPSSHKSHNRYEGDNEYSDSLNSDAGYSTSSTIADFEDPAVLAAGPSSSGVPVLSFSQGGSSGSDEDDGRVNGSRTRVSGDVTPRIMTRAIDSASPLPNHRTQASLVPTNGTLLRSNVKSLLRTSTSTTSISTLTHITAQQEPSQPRQRTLVPFQADSDLWPYPRAPVDERDPEDSDVVELDFSDTRALSDPAVFIKKQQKQKQTGKKKSRRERAADRERERDAIEKSWDDPTQGQAQMVDMLTLPGAPTVAPTDLQPSMSTNQVNGKHVVVNGATNGSFTSKGSMSPDEAQRALLAALGVHPKAPAPTVSRKQFVQEILSLVYSDTAFVDQVYQEYCSSFN